MTWRILKITVRSERVALEKLNELGIPAYAPMHVTQARHAKRKQTRTRPLLPGYIFADLSDAYAWHEAKGLRMVREIMREVPLPVLGAIIFADACHEYDETWTPPRPKSRWQHRWKPGDPVKIRGGAFDGFTGSVVRSRNKLAMDIELLIFGRQTEVEVEHRHLEAA